MELKIDGLCAGVVGNSTDAKKADNTRVYLQECIEGMRSQQWRQASTGQLVNLLSGKCLEAGNSGSLYARAFISPCGKGDHQKWDLSEGRYRNKAHQNRFLAVAHCGERSDERWLELRDLEESSRCICTQTWNEVCTKVR